MQRNNLEERSMDFYKVEKSVVSIFSSIFGYC